MPANSLSPKYTSCLELQHMCSPAVDLPLLTQNLEYASNKLKLIIIYNTCLSVQSFFSFFSSLDSGQGVRLFIHLRLVINHCKHRKIHQGKKIKPRNKRSMHLKKYMYTCATFNIQVSLKIVKQQILKAYEENCMICLLF